MSQIYANYEVREVWGKTFKTKIKTDVTTKNKIFYAKKGNRKILGQIKTITLGTDPLF